MEYLKNVVTLSYDKSKCIGCKKCIEVCPRNVFKMNGNNSEIINKDSCIECGACMNNCLGNALKVDAGVGCAYAVIKGSLSNSEPTCGCSESKSKSSCCG